MKNFLYILVEKKLLMNNYEQKYRVRQKKTQHFCRVSPHEWVWMAFTPPELVFLV